MFVRIFIRTNIIFLETSIILP